MTATISRSTVITLNNLYEIEIKLKSSGDPQKLLRNVERIKEACAEEMLFFEDPSGQDFKSTRTDLEASISGAESEQLVVIDVIKPIIRYGDEKFSLVVQKGIVVVGSAKDIEANEDH